MAKHVPKINKGDPITADWLNAVHGAAYHIPTSTKAPMSFRRDSSGEHFLIGDVGAKLSWAKLASDYEPSSGGTVIGNPCNYDGTAEESDINITLYVSNPQTTAAYANSDMTIDLLSDDVVAYFPFSDASGMLINMTDFGIPGGGALYKVVSQNADAEPVWDWVRAHA